MTDLAMNHPFGEGGMEFFDNFTGQKMGFENIE